MAVEGYPGAYERDCVIPNLDAADRMPDVKVFHSGTALRADPAIGREGRVVSDGGRVLSVTALGATLEEAQSRAYEAARAVKFPGAWYRRDIGGRPGRPGN
jgi:phosphoribosylamine--glycine ligase